MKIASRKNCFYFLGQVIACFIWLCPSEKRRFIDEKIIKIGLLEEVGEEERGRRCGVIAKEYGVSLF